MFSTQLDSFCIAMITVQGWMVWFDAQSFYRSLQPAQGSGQICTFNRQKNRSACCPPPPPYSCVRCDITIFVGLIENIEA